MGDRELSSADFQALYERLRGQAQWGRGDRRGALNHITPDRLLAAETVRELAKSEMPEGLVKLGGGILRLVLDYDTLIAQGRPVHEAIAAIRSRPRKRVGAGQSSRNVTTPVARS